MTLKRQLLLGFLSVVAASCLGIAVTLWWVGASGMGDVGATSAAALQERAHNQLATLRGIKSAQVVDLMETVKAQLAVMARDRTAIDATAAFAYEFDLVRHESELAREQVEAMRPRVLQSLEGAAFKGWSRFKRYEGIPGATPPGDVASLIPADVNALLLWNFFIAASPAPAGTRQTEDSPSGLVAGYADTHAKFNPVFRDFAERFDFADVYLIAPTTGRVIYSLRKNTDYATSLTTGPWAQTALGTVFRKVDEAARDGDLDTVASSDFVPYQPEGNAPRAFLATPVVDGGQYLAVLAFSLPESKLEKLMLSGGRFADFGLGETGDTYLAGPDKTLRTSSRFSPDGLDVLRRKADALPVQQALEGQTGQGLVQDHRGKSVLAAWQPLQIMGMRWALVAQMDTGEALAASAEVAREATATSARMAGAAVVSLIIFLSAAGGVVYWVVGRVMTPIHRLGSYAEAVAGGNFDAAIDGDFPAELDALRGSTRTMVARLKDRLGFSQGILDAISRNFPCMTLDTQGRITFLGERLLDVAGRSGNPDDYLGQTVGRFFYDDDTRKTRSDEALQSRQLVEGEMVINRADGEGILQVNANPMFDLDGKQTGAFTLYFDLTTIRRQEAEIRTKNEKIAAVAAQAVAIAEEVSQSATLLARQVEEASRGAGKQSERATETATAMGQMNAASTEVARSAANAADSAHEARTSASAGADAVSRLVDSILSIRQRTEELEAFMGELGSRTDAVGNVMQVISDIADQTNLLALNAAIEAARAGEAGRGFAVVADEVRKLAEKTMTATREVGSAIAAIQDGATRSIAGVQQAGEAVRQSAELARASGSTLDHIVGIVGGTADQVGSIAAAAEEQSAASEEVARAVDEVNLVARHTADGMAEAEAAIEHLAAQAAQLQQLIRVLRDE